MQRFIYYNDVYIHGDTVPETLSDKPFPESLIDDISHTILQDALDEFRPENVLKGAMKDTFTEFTDAINELKPSSILKYILFGE